VTTTHVPSPAAAPPAAGGRTGPDTQKRPRRRRGRFAPYLFLLPGAALFITFMAWPMVQAFRMSLYDWNVLPGGDSTFVGADNYVRAAGDPVFWRALVNTGVYMLATVPTQMALGLVIAVLLDRIRRGRVLFRTLFYLPVVTSWVVVSLLFKYLFNSQAGLVNHVLTDTLGVLDGNVPWLQGRWTALAVIALLGIWKGVGWSMLIFLAGLRGIPGELLDAAAVDGASPVQRFFRVILPLLKPVIAFVTIMLVIGGFNVFISVFLLTGGGPSRQTEVLLTYMYDQAFGFLEFGYGAAIAYVLTAIVFGVSVLQMRLFRYGEDTT
jgi:multiple sugar transport system permease protein